jgi:hypothetical protein
MVEELDYVVLTRDVSELGLQKGDLGVIVLVHGQGEGYEVEFTTLTGETVAVVSLRASDVRPVGAQEIAHARVVQAA